MCSKCQVDCILCGYSYNDEYLGKLLVSFTWFFPAWHITSMLLSSPALILKALIKSWSIFPLLLIRCVFMGVYSIFMTWLMLNDEERTMPWSGLYAFSVLRGGEEGDIWAECGHSQLFFIWANQEQSESDCPMANAAFKCCRKYQSHDMNTFWARQTLPVTTRH